MGARETTIRSMTRQIVVDEWKTDLEHWYRYEYDTEVPVNEDNCRELDRERLMENISDFVYEHLQDVMEIVYSRLCIRQDGTRSVEEEWETVRNSFVNLVLAAYGA